MFTLIQTSKRVILLLLQGGRRHQNYTSTNKIMLIKRNKKLKRKERNNKHVRANYKANNNNCSITKLYLENLSAHYPRKKLQKEKNDVHK